MHKITKQKKRILVPAFKIVIEKFSCKIRAFEHKNIIGIKDSSANMKRIEHMIEETRGKDVSVLTGTDDILFPALVGGVSGSMTAFATIFPEKICSLYQAVETGEYAVAKEIQFSMMADLRKADKATFPQGYKRLMENVSGIRFGDKEVEPE